MAKIAQVLIQIAQSVEPNGGFFGYFDLVDALEASPAALERFKSALSSASADELDGIYEVDEQYGWIVMGAADAMDLLPDDPRLFLSKADAAALPDDKIIGALVSACIVNDVETVSRLATRVDVNSLDHHKQTALGYAVGNNHAECVRILLSNGANPNRVQNWGNTAMHDCAMSVSSKEIFQMLQTAGGDVSIKNDEGQSVLDLLKQNRRQHWIAH
ncbi:ankyrin repeat domain-containing protein [Stratiformator vulcanicus]|uniref:Ankyrin repeats (3 copies) n=1 Tax=Stratiformator vulcanicus TaxID=2527980 RepID=A0A517R3G1_9PLAN|nr:ankyrin repeat domain-containing protein [Stratiformator vulcanicus]QDT38421.1 Ankyrin repeats (3 copies) [Stratiformator vulcanicus]